MSHQEELEHRIDCFLVIQEQHLSMAMMINLMDGLAASYGVPKREVIELLNERAKVVDVCESTVIFDIVYREGE